LRRATRGANAGNQFYGCSNYPKCKYIQNINQKAID
ncbi:MAG: topoisomerase DNA-binding C4 zinc finger domain-containing protein, partial [Clostridia bacterium]|nr:topoisomerase DNA-binding C4 zinc finger domain-containing protein [Clostridia bacterium]